jgi:hypothetical protein
MGNRIPCPQCEYQFGQEVRLLEHLSSVHSIVDYEQLYCDVFLEGVKPRCACSKECAHFLIWRGWKKGYTSKYARGHNARIDSVYLNKERQAEMASKRVAGFAEGKYHVWNAGMSKETSAKVKDSSEKISKTIKQKKLDGVYVNWRSVDPEKAQAAVRKMSAKKQELYSTGILSPWNKGLTKHDDPRVASISKGIKENYQESDDASAKRLTPEQFLERVLSVGKFDLLSNPSDYKNKYQKFSFRCHSCNATQLKSLVMLETSPVCFFCKPKESKSQLQIFEFVRSLEPTALLSNRDVIAPKELDIWVPSKNFAIEYNGLYWHSSAVLSDNLYHQKKHEECWKRSISLLSIYEDEWRDKRAIVEGMIRHRIKQPIERWSARNLQLVELAKDRAANFFDNNHLEGFARSSVTFGLEHKSTGELLAAMSLRKPFHRKYSDALEVARCCVLAGHSVRGWLGKLTTKAIEYAHGKAARLITYVDGRVGRGNGYEQSGWTRAASENIPRFWWTDFHNRFNRFKYRANRAQGITQEEAAQCAGVVAIYGCSNSLYEILL